MINLPTELLLTVIRHELAHLYCFIKYSNEGMGHNKLYHDTCLGFGWNKEVWSAKMEINIELTNHIEDKTNKVIEKIKKLLNLASSTNQHESEIATAMANNLLIKYNLEHINQERSDNDDTTLKRILNGKRISGKEKAIYQILQDFFIYPVFNHFRGGFYLEIIGSSANVQLAEYVAHYLDTELDYLWTRAKLDQDLKGKRDKNSFFIGVAQGFCEKNKTSQRESCSNKELVTLSNQLTTHKKRVYSRLSHQNTQAVTNHKAKDIGRKKGKSLSINPAVKNKFISFLLS